MATIQPKLHKKSKFVQKKISDYSKMAIEATDVDQPFQEVVDAPDAPDAPAPAPEEPQDAPPAPRARGRPAGVKDKQPRKRPHRAAEPEELLRPVTRRSAPPKQRARRVRIVESASEASSSAEEEEPLTPRTARHRQWAEYRQQMSDAHQASVNRYAALFDRMLA